MNLTKLVEQIKTVAMESSGNRYSRSVSQVGRYSPYIKLAEKKFDNVIIEPEGTENLTTYKNSESKQKKSGEVTVSPQHPNFTQEPSVFPKK